MTVNRRFKPEKGPEADRRRENDRRVAEGRRLADMLWSVSTGVQRRPDTVHNNEGDPPPRKYVQNRALSTM